MDREAEVDEWRALGPWLYHTIAAYQMYSASPTLDWAPSGGNPSPSSESHILVASNSCGTSSADPEAPPPASVMTLVLSLPRAGRTVNEFGEGLGGIRYEAGVSLHHVLRARYLRKGGSPGLAAVKQTHGVILADLRDRRLRGDLYPLPSKRPRQAAGKSRGLSCQPGGGNIAFSDFGNAEPRPLYSVLAWDVGWGAGTGGRQKVATFQSRIEDVAFSHHNPSGLYAVTEDGYLRCIDLRIGSRKELFAPGSMALKCVAGSIVDPHLVAAGGAEGLVLFDERQTKGHLLVLNHADQEVGHCAFHPSDDALVATATADGKCWIWDLRLMGANPTGAPGSGDTFPSELVFVHSGHSPNAITDLAWCPDDTLPNTLASTDTAGMFHVWCPAVLAAQGNEASKRESTSTLAPAATKKPKEGK